MSFSVIASPKFRKEAKRLAKKYPSLKSELIELYAALSENPTMGKELGKNTYKLRIGIESKGKGKSGGARVITYVVNEDEEVFLLTIYDKSERSTVDDATIKQLIKTVKP